MVDARQLEQVLLGFGDMGAAHMQHRMVADVPALTGAVDEGMEAHRSIMAWLLLIIIFIGEKSERKT